MLYTASDQSDAIGTPLVVERSLFCLAPNLFCAWRSGRLSPQRLDREYRAQLRLSYRTSSQQWIDLVKQAALDDVTLIGDPAITHILFDCLVKVGADRGLLLDPDEDDLGAALIEYRHLTLLKQAGHPQPYDPAFLTASRMPHRKSFR